MAESKGRPGSASQRPTGGDKAGHMRSGERRQDARLGLEADEPLRRLIPPEARHFHDHRGGTIRSGDAEDMPHGAGVDALPQAEAVDFGPRSESLQQVSRPLKNVVHGQF